MSKETKPKTGFFKKQEKNIKKEIDIPEKEVMKEEIKIESKSEILESPIKEEKVSSKVVPEEERRTVLVEAPLIGLDQAQKELAKKVEEENKDKKVKKYMFTYNTPNDRKIPIKFRRGRMEMLKFGMTVFLTEEEYMCHRQWLKELKD